MIVDRSRFICVAVSLWWLFGLDFRGVFTRFACLQVSVFICVSVCLCVFVFTCLFIILSWYLSVCLFDCWPVYVDLCVCQSVVTFLWFALALCPSGIIPYTFVPCLAAFVGLFICLLFYCSLLLLITHEMTGSFFFFFFFFFLKFFGAGGKINQIQTIIICLFV